MKSKSPAVKTYLQLKKRRTANVETVKKQRGLTLVELLVALAISTVITIAAFSALIISRQGFTATDVASQLRDNSRFATDLLQRLGVQAGYLNDTIVTQRQQGEARIPAITGFNNALIDVNQPETQFITRPTTSVDGSDILILRYQPAETFPGSGQVDNAMVNCAGNAAPQPAANPNDWVVNVIHIAPDTLDGEPTLMCTVVDGRTPPLINPIIPPTTQSIIKGVETLQVLYGVNGVALLGEPPAPANTQNLATRFLRADQLVVPGNPIVTNENWRRVRSLKIGMVIRGPEGSAVERSNLTYFPLGAGPNDVNGQIGTSTRSNADPGSAFTPGNDTRLRQVVNFTIHIRNFQE